MARIFSLNRRIFRLDVENWREMRRRGRYLRYYLKPLQDDRNSLARNIDFYGPLAAVLMVTWAAAASWTGSRPGLLAVALPLTALEVFLAFRLRRVFRDNAAVHDRLWRAGRQCQERIKKIGSVRKLEKLVVEILEKIDGFTDAHIVGGTARNEKISFTGIGVRALYQGEPVAVGCLLPDAGGSPVPAEKVLKFRQEMQNLDFRRGILVAAGTFSGEARRVALEKGRERRIALVDLYRLVELARLTGHQVFPAAAGDPGTGSDAGADVRRRLLRNALSRDKARGYLYAAVIMLVMCWLTRGADLYGPGYIAFGALNLALSLYCRVSNREDDLLGPVRTGR